MLIYDAKNGNLSAAINMDIIIITRRTEKRTNTLFRMINSTYIF